MQAIEFVHQYPRPTYKSGHTLIPLTDCPRILWRDDAFTLEMVTYWGYCLTLYAHDNGDLYDNPTSDASKWVNRIKAAADPTVYPIDVQVYRYMQTQAAKLAQIETGWTHNALPIASTNRTRKPGWSGDPLTEYLYWQMTPLATTTSYSMFNAQTLLSITKMMTAFGGTPIRIPVVRHDGESGMDYYSACYRQWIQDQGIIDAVNAVMPAGAPLATLGTVPVASQYPAWRQVTAQHKVRLETVTRDAVLAVTGGTPEYLYYYSIQNQQGMNNSQWMYGFDYHWMKNLVTRPTGQLYYNVGQHFDVLWKQLTYMTGYGIAQGSPLACHFVSGGWRPPAYPTECADPTLWMGFLKGVYMAGSVSGIWSYFNDALANNYNAGDQGSACPDWLTQMMSLAQAQATFSWVEGFLRQGTILNGPYTHPWNADGVQPAYDHLTPSGTTHVLVRKANSANEWLVYAWNAAGGADVRVQVTVSGLGTITVTARAGGALYLVKPDVQPWLLDTDPLNPSATMNAQLTAARAGGGEGGTVSATFDPALSHYRDHLRLAVGDMDTVNPLLADATYDALLGTYGYTEGLAKACDALVSMYGQRPTSYGESGGMTVNWASRVAVWQQLAKDARGGRVTAPPGANVPNYHAEVALTDIQLSDEGSSGVMEKFRSD